jgi:hypothetical protein
MKAASAALEKQKCHHDVLSDSRNRDDLSLILPAAEPTI